MSGEVVNLRRARKEKQRAEKANEAAANRARFGRTRVERDVEANRAMRATRHLDAHKLPAGDGDAG